MQELTEIDRLYISQIAQDHETGNHLLYTRTEEYRKRFDELQIAFMQQDFGLLTERSILLLDCYNSMFHD